jgi:hypothetical protein
MFSIIKRTFSQGYVFVLCPLYHLIEDSFINEAIRPP